VIHCRLLFRRIDYGMRGGEFSGSTGWAGNQEYTDSVSGRASRQLIATHAGHGESVTMLKVVSAGELSLDQPVSGS
jgi:hypothetical protein